MSPRTPHALSPTAGGTRAERRVGAPGAARPGATALGHHDGVPSAAPMWRVVAAVLALSAGVASAASASSFTVNPTQILLSAKSASALLTLRNESEETLRFQLTVFAWDQSAKGEMQLQPTQDIVFFPPLLSLGPRESRNVRVGTAGRLGGVASSPASAATSQGPATPVVGTAPAIDVVEKTYRIFVEELPPQSASAGRPAVRVLTKMGVPIFLQPSKTLTQGSLRDLALKDGVLRFNVQNTGNVHFVLDRVRVRGTNPAGAVVLDEQADGWYVLAGGLRSYELKLPTPACGTVTTLAIDASVGGTVLTQRLETPPAACVP